MPDNETMKLRDFWRESADEWDAICRQWNVEMQKSKDEEEKFLIAVRWYEFAFNGWNNAIQNWLATYPS